MVERSTKLRAGVVAERAQALVSQCLPQMMMRHHAKAPRKVLLQQVLPRQVLRQALLPRQVLRQVLPLQC